MDLTHGNPESKSSHAILHSCGFILDHSAEGISVLNIFMQSIN